MRGATGEGRPLRMTRGHRGGPGCQIEGQTRPRPSSEVTKRKYLEHPNVIRLILRDDGDDAEKAYESPKHGTSFSAGPM